MAKETEPITGGVSLTLAIHHFVLLKVFRVSCTAAWSCLRAASAILLHRWKCLGSENTDLREQLPLSCLLACRLSWQSAKAEVRGVLEGEGGGVSLQRWPPLAQACASSHVNSSSRRSEGCTTEYGASTRTRDFSMILNE